MSEASTRDGRKSDCLSAYGEEIPGNLTLYENLGVCAYRKDEDVTLIFELSDRSVVATIRPSEIQAPNYAEAGALYLWSQAHELDVLAARIATWCMQGREILPQKSPVRRALVESGYDDNLIQLVVSSIKSHYSEAEQRRAEESRRAEQEFISKVRIGKPPRPPYGEEITDWRLKAFGMRVYQRNWLGRQRVTFVFRPGLMSEVVIATGPTLAYFSGTTVLRRDSIIDMLAVAGRELQKGASANDLGGPFRSWRVAFRQSG